MNYEEIIFASGKILHTIIMILLIFLPIAYKLSLRNKVELEKKKEVTLKILFWITYFVVLIKQITSVLINDIGIDNNILVNVVWILNFLFVGFIVESVIIKILFDKLFKNSKFNKFIKISTIIIWFLTISTNIYTLIITSMYDLNVSGRTIYLMILCIILSFFIFKRNKNK